MRLDGRIAFVTGADSGIGRIDVLVNNAGRGTGGDSSLEASTDLFLQVLNVDLVAPFVLMRDAGKLMVEQGKGSIINISSVHERIPRRSPTSPSSSPRTSPATSPAAPSTPTAA